MKKTIFAAILAVILLFAGAVSAETYKDIARDIRNQAVTDIRGNCVLTKWDVKTQKCGEVVDDRLTVYFDFGKATLDDRATNKIFSIANLIKNNSRIVNARVVGYADPIGDADANMALSKRRAEAVATNLQKLVGINVDLGDIKARGEEDAVAKCDGKAGNSLIACLRADRRVVVELELIR